MCRVSRFAEAAVSRSARKRSERARRYQMAGKRSGSKTKSGGGAKRGKSKVKRELKDLDVRKSKGVRGGLVVRKAGEKPVEY
jgi:hypothetical protein